MQFCRCEDVSIVVGEKQTTKWVKFQKRYEVDGNNPFWANRGRRGDDTGPFWANRGRRTDKHPSDLTREAVDNEWNTQLEEPLYAEESRWILVRRDDERRASSYIAPDYQPYFVTRGKRPQQPELNRHYHETSGSDAGTAVGQDRTGKACDNYTSCNRIRSSPCGEEMNNKVARRARE